MKRGDIVLVRFPFTDHSSTKLRPALIISVNNEKEVCVSFISSVIPMTLEATDFLLTSNHQDFSVTGLKRDSVLKMNKIATLDRKILLGRLGSLSKELQEVIDDKLKLALGL